MNKTMLYLMITVGGLVGSYLPVILLHADPFGILSITCGVIGSIAGILVAYKLNQ